MIFDILKFPDAKKIKDLDHFSATEVHAKIIQKKKFLKKLYVDYYNEMKDHVGYKEDAQDVIIELGSGGGFIKEVIPSIITSDILEVSMVDKCFSVDNIPYEDASVDAFIMLNVFHHIKKPEDVLNEVNRCLKKGGKLVMIEPANTPWSRFIFQNFHHELFDPTSGWSIKGTGPLSCGNGAMPWIVFIRDREKFQQLFPNLCITQYQNHTSLRYILSGGISLRQLVPTFSYSFLKWCEGILKPFNNWIGMFSTIILQKQ